MTRIERRTALRTALLVSAGTLVLALVVGTRSDADSTRPGSADKRAQSGQSQRSASALTGRSTPSDAGFKVHEWGTFTSMQGSTGVELDGMQHEGEALPDFVHSYTNALPSPFRALGNHSRNPQVRRTRSKMETPVIYFHTAKPMDVEVSVYFVQGLMSHYFPAPTNIIPEIPANGAQNRTIDLETIGASMLQWRANIAPDLTARDIPPATASHYAIARAVDAAKVRVETAAGTTETERFLFYRGLGRDNPAIQITAQARGKARIHNTEAEAIPAAFAVEMQANRGRFSPIGQLAANGQAEFDLSDTRFASKESTVAALSEQMFKALCARGLHADEARSMVDTWADQWFGSPGTRVVYIVPNSYVERTLPMSITPAPDELVRVFVGRIEYLTPEEERRVEDDVRASGSLNRDERRPAMARLAAEGRFMEPKLRRIAAITRDPDVRARAAALIRTIENGSGAPTARDSH